MLASAEVLVDPSIPDAPLDRLLFDEIQVGDKSAKRI